MIALDRPPAAFAHRHRERVPRELPRLLALARLLVDAVALGIAAQRVRVRAAVAVVVRTDAGRGLRRRGLRAERIDVDLECQWLPSASDARRPTRAARRSAAQRRAVYVSAGVTEMCALSSWRCPTRPRSASRRRSARQHRPRHPRAASCEAACSRRRTSCCRPSASAFARQCRTTRLVCGRISTTDRSVDALGMEVPAS